MKQLVILFLMLCSTAVQAHAGSADQWAKKSVYVLDSLMKRNPQGAVQQAVGNHGIKLSRQTRVHANAHNVGLRQNIPGVNKLSRHLNTGYNANVPIRFDQRPKVSHSANLNTRSKYFSNTTSFSPSSKK